MSDPFRQQYRELEQGEQAHLDDIKSAAGELWNLFDEVENREMAIARTKLEEAVMWATKGVTA